MLVFFFLMLCCIYLPTNNCVAFKMHPTVSAQWQTEVKPSSSRQCRQAPCHRHSFHDKYFSTVVTLTNQSDKLDGKCPSTPQNCVPLQSHSERLELNFDSPSESNQVLDLEWAALLHSSEHRYQHWYRLQFQFVGASLSPYMQMHSKRQTSTTFCATSGKKSNKKHIWVTLAQKSRPSLGGKALFHCFEI